MHHRARKRTQRISRRIREVGEPLGVPFGDGEEWANILEHKVNDNLSFYFIEFNRFYDRP